MVNAMVSLHILGLVMHMVVLKLTVQVLLAVILKQKSASRMKNISKSSIFQLVHNNGTARQTIWQEPKMLAQKEIILLNGLSNLTIKLLISSCLSTETL